MKAIPLDAGIGIGLGSGNGIGIVPVALAHADALAALVRRNSSHLCAFLPPVARLASPQAARAHLEAAATRAQRGETLEWHLFAGDALCGSIRLKEISADDRKAQIGYFLGSEFGGRGIATLAVRAVLAYCFGPLALNRVELRCASTNTASMRIAERLGFTREGVLRQDEFLNGAFVDNLVYGLLRGEFTPEAAALGG